MHPASRTITYSGLFIALGILLPVIFHMAGIGPILLPMYWPVAAAGFFLAPLPALITGILTPVLSLALTGMPPVPVVYKMVLELALLAWTISVLRQKLNAPRMLILLAGLTAAMTAGIAGAAALAPLLGLPAALYAAGGLIRSLPGIVCMLIFLPPLLKRITAIQNPAPEDSHAA